MSDRIGNIIAGIEYELSVGSTEPHPAATVHLLANEWEAMKEAVKREPPHVYQNRPDGYDPFFMRYCPVCNGYYGVPHEGVCNVKGGCQAYDTENCACRKHREQHGLPREGSYGWITVTR